ncbi:hypothetical protein [Streptomyces sp. 900116325]
MSAPMTPEQYSHIRAHLSQAALKYGGIDYVSPTFGLVRDAMAEVDRLRARVDEVERAYTYDTAALKKRADELDKTLGEVMAERDGMHDALDQFALTVAPEDVIGEHSSGNNPWANALELLTPMAEVDRLRAELAALPAPVVETAFRDALGNVWPLNHFPAETEAQVLKTTPTIQRTVRISEWTEVAS